MIFRTIQFIGLLALIIISVIFVLYWTLKPKYAFDSAKENGIKYSELPECVKLKFENIFNNENDLSSPVTVKAYTCSDTLFNVEVISPGEGNSLKYTLHGFYYIINYGKSIYIDRFVLPIFVIDQNRLYCISSDSYPARSPKPTADILDSLKYYCVLIGKKSN